MVSFTSKTPVKYDVLSVGDVHIWQLDLEVAFSKLEESILSVDESKKINRLRDPKHRVRAMAMKIQLRQLLSKYLLVEPSEIEFGLEEFNKPFILNSPLSFNISHSNDNALVAISSCKQMGVDVENWRIVDNLEGLVSRHFSVDEANLWNAIEDDKKVTTFFDIWTCKEAFIKATGRGLGMGLVNCSFSLLKPNKLLSCPEEYGDASEWTCISLPVWKDASASLLMRTDKCNVNMYKFKPKSPHRAD
jgi:4'-phosphopantetheinyl transferase